MRESRGSSDDALPAGSAGLYQRKGADPGPGRGFRVTLGTNRARRRPERREGDSNPRASCPATRFPVAPVQPLRHLSSSCAPWRGRKRTGDADIVSRELRSHRAEDYPLDRLRADKQVSVSVVLPAREVADTIGPILERLLPLRDAGAVDELLVIDAASADGTAAVAERAGATVVQESAVLPEFGPARGKGDALWRAVAVARGEVVAFVDADTRGLRPALRARRCSGRCSPTRRSPTSRAPTGGRSGSASRSCRTAAGG